MTKKLFVLDVLILAIKIIQFASSTFQFSLSLLDVCAVRLEVIHVSMPKKIQINLISLAQNLLPLSAWITGLNL